MTLVKYLPFWNIWSRSQLCSRWSRK